MAHFICTKLDKLEGKIPRECNDGCEYYKFPHLKTACVLSEVYSVAKGEQCFIYQSKQK
jgi:hypothetical protein